MILFHFTDQYRLESIKKHGIYKGDVPISIVGGYNAPWFTSDPNPSHQSWAAGGFKTGIRLTVEFQEGDSNLKKWTDIISEELDKLDGNEKQSRISWYKALNETGGGGQDNWYVYHGVVPPEWIKKVDRM